MTKKEIAQKFLILSSQGNSKDAFDTYVDENFKHHNPYFKGDKISLMKAMEENATKNPHKTFEIQRSLEDGDLVAIHSRAQLSQNQNSISVIHIFKFLNNKIIELWDIGNAVPAQSPNENGMF